MSNNLLTTRAIDPTTGQPFGPEFNDTTPGDLDTAIRQAAEAGRWLRDASPAALAEALRHAADTLDTHSPKLVPLADRETALGPTRLTGEVGRTTGQLRMFADLITTGTHLDATVTRLDGPAAPARDIRRMHRPIGTVAVFGASNFPFAFGVAGGDTASALAAGCPVIAKAHPAHPGTSALAADLLTDALTHAGLPDGTFTLVHGAATEIGAALVRHPLVAAVAFTGSTAGGRALYDQAATRPDPIPVYAEMGSLNPVVLAPTALHETAALHAVIQQLSAAITSGWGQFCTKPGLLLVPAPHVATFTDALSVALGAITPAHLLTPRIRDAYTQLTSTAATIDGVTTWTSPAAPGGLAVPATLLRTDAATLLARAELRQEMFGPAAIVVAVDDPDQVDAVIDTLGGNLTGTVHGDATDPWVRRAISAFEPRVGRIVVGGVPTGVAVVPAMQHGGPYPSSTSPAHTSVGTAAITRFLRPVAFQDVPDDLLPPALADANPWRIERVVDGHHTTEAIRRPS